MMSFKRARSEEQRTERRQAIMDTAAAMLAEMPVAQVSLNELSRRVGLAKSNVLRYFESREAVLLELLNAALKQWLDHLAELLATAVDAEQSEVERGDQVAAVLAASLKARPVLCDLISSQAAVLEHNVSPQIAAQYKRSTIANIGVLAGLVRQHLPEVGESDAVRLAGVAVMMAGTVWSHTRPSAAMLAAYESDPALAVLRLDFADTLRELLEVVISGLLSRAG